MASFTVVREYAPDERRMVDALALLLGAPAAAIGHAAGAGSERQAAPAPPAEQSEAAGPAVTEPAAKESPA